jgi:hypothetical protein
VHAAGLVLTNTMCLLNYTPCLISNDDPTAKRTTNGC